MKKLMKQFIPPIFIILKTKIFSKKSALQSKLLELIDGESGFYIELGANDGITQSNTIFLEKRGWKGILIEPSLNKFLECKTNRSNANYFFCNAVISFDYQDKYVDMQYSNLMTIATSLNNNIKDVASHLKSSEKFLSPHEQIFEYGAVARTLNDILIESKAPKIIDFFSLDVEGSETEVLRGIDFSEFTFRNILVETQNHKSIHEFLTNKGYVLENKLTHHDYYYSYQFK